MLWLMEARSKEGKIVEKKGAWKKQGDTHSAGPLSAYRTRTDSSEHVPSTAAITTRSMAVSVAVVTLGDQQLIYAIHHGGDEAIEEGGGGRRTGYRSPSPSRSPSELALRSVS